MMTYLDMIDLAAQTAMGRLHSALRKARVPRSASAAGDPIHNEMVAILKEAFAAGCNEGHRIEMVAALRENRDALRRAYDIIGELEDSPTQQTTDCLSQIRAAGENTVALLRKVDLAAIDAPRAQVGK